MTNKFGNLTDYEKAVCAAWFGMLEPNKGVLRFAMQNVRPTKRSQETLDKLVAEGIVTRTDEADGAVHYVPLVDCGGLLDWFEDNYDRFEFNGVLVERIDPESNEPTMTITMSPDGDPRVVVMHGFMNEIMKLTREQHDQFLSFLDNWGYFKQRKKDDCLYRDQLRSMIVKSLKKTKEAFPK